MQHKIQKHGAAFFEWLEGGAYVYICGKKEPMSVDVENAILAVIEEFGNRNEVQAQQYLERMKEEGRFLKDVY
ncbi:MAG: hypothetical protein EOO04_14870 [Chitinophagaceae bacterium]|nr:MAG: hypothetical protein EOO04_14870 [Chitinophagaceae bacterium]